MANASRVGRFECPFLMALGDMFISALVGGIAHQPPRDSLVGNTGRRKFSDGRVDASSSTSSF